MEAAQTQVLDSQGNLISAPQVEKEKVIFSPSRSRKATDSPISPELSDKDPLALKLESALKRSIADRTGDLKLKQEAALQQSLADKMGARAVMSKEQLERTKKEAEQLRVEAAAKQSTADRTGDAALKKEAAAQQHLADKLIASANKSLAALALEDNKTAVPTPAVSTPAATAESETETPLIVQVLQDALKALLESAAQKQSLADRTGDLKLKQEAALAQSKVDKMRAQLAKELQVRQPAPLALMHSASAPQLVPVPRPADRAPAPRQPLSPPVERRSTQHHIPRAPPAETTSSSGPEKYKPPAMRRSPSMAAANTSPQKQPKKENKNHSEKPADRTNARSWRRSSNTPAPLSPSNNKTSSAVSNNNDMKSKTPKVDATTNCIEEEFEQQA